MLWLNKKAAMNAANMILKHDHLMRSKGTTDINPLFINQVDVKKFKNADTELCKLFINDEQ